MEYLFYYLVFINIISFLLYGLDKLLAIFKRNRIREVLLHIFSLFGGCLGSICGMFVFRHKIKKNRFYIWNIFMIVVWGYIIYILVC
jgi:uncharacterized membrane protein YsdA (DUF1294 family)